jgi:hypothetical protein
MNYKIFPTHKRTINVRFGKDVQKYFVQFPRTLFFDYGRKLYCFAINEKNELCYMPFYNISEVGAVCLVYQADEYNKQTVNNKIQKFFSEPFKICGDNYAYSVNKYLKLNIPERITVKPEFIPEIKEKLKTLYQQPFNLIKCSTNDCSHAKSLNIDFAGS